MQFYFIRHAQSANNHLWDQTSSSKGRSEDPDLTPLGEQQAQHLAEFIKNSTPGTETEDRNAYNHKGFGLTHIYCSPMLRAVKTGLVLARSVGLPITVWKDLHEGGGIYLDDEATGEQVGLPGKPRSFFEQNYPDLTLTDEIKEEGWWNRPFEGREERMLRAERFLGELRRRHGDTSDRVAVISHGAFFNYFIYAVIHHVRQDGLWFLMNNTGISRIDFGPEYTDIMYLNRCDFLPREMIS